MRPLTRQQLGGTAVVAALGAAATATSLLGRPAIAIALLGPIATVLFLAVVQVRRRVAELQRTTQELTGEVRSWARRADSARRGLTVASERAQRSSAELQRTLTRGLERGQDATARSLERMGNQLVRRQRDQTREVEALVQLYRQVEPRAPMPSSGHWALNPTDLLELWSVIDRLRPDLVLELGSGVSSVWIGYAVQRYGGRLVSVDHDPAYAAQSRAVLRRHGLDEVTEVRDAPLKPVTVHREEFLWYDPAGFSGLAGVDLLVVDGPPGNTGRLARYPALHLLHELLSPRASIVLDDADRPDEQEALRRWTGTVGGLEREPATLGHVAVLTYARPT